jgi:uncharacterized protein (TIGR03437 family)
LIKVLWKILCSEILLLAAVRLGFSQTQLVVSPAAINFMQYVDGSPTKSGQCEGNNCPFSVLSTGNTAIPYTAYAPFHWLTVGDFGSAIGTTPDTVYVSISEVVGHLTAGTYSGFIIVTAPLATNSPLRVPVTLTVVNYPALIVSGTNLTFNATVGDTSTVPQSIVLKSAASPLETGFTAGVATGAYWLSVSSIAGLTPSTLTVNVNPTGLPAGTYNGTISISSKAGTKTVVPVTLTITTPKVVTVSPPQLNVAYQIGGPVPNPQALQVSGSTSGLTFNVQSSTGSGGNWLLVNPSGGTTPAVITVSVNPTNLVAGSYQGTINVSGTNGASGSTLVPVGLTVTAQPPTIISLLNAASFLNHAISPGEVVSIIGTAIGPPAPLQLQPDSSGKVSTSLGNVQVLFAGHLAPLTYVSSTQINCVVPYEIIGISTPSVQVKYAGQASKALELTSAPVSPGVFATNGTGQAAALNQDGSVNGPTSPEAAGNIVSIFMTGEGQTSPPGVTGTVTCQSGCNTLQQIPVPQQPVTAIVGNQPATVTFYGEAPGLVSGVLQVNLVVPPNTPSGAIPLAISVGGTQSQTGVTLSVR